MRLKSDTAYKQLKSTYQNKETVVDQLVIKKLGNTYCIYQVATAPSDLRLVLTVTSTYITTPTNQSPELIQRALETFSIQCDENRQMTAPIDFSRKFTVISIDATGKNDAPKLSSLHLSPTESAKVQHKLNQHIEHLKSSKTDIYFRKTRYSTNYYELHLCIDGATRSVNGLERKVSSAIVRPIEMNEFFNTPFINLTDLLAFIGIGIQYQD